MGEAQAHMIDVRNVHKRFGTVAAVSGVSFTAPDGCITGLLGRNGAGKTTTLAMTCGLLRPDRGDIQVGSASGHPMARRRQVGALLDHKGLYERLTARENILYFGALHGLSGRGLDDRVQDVLRQLGLEDVADRRIAGFSQGERMKVALARAIVHGPPHLVLDEPTNGLDIPTVRGLREALRQMRDQGTCIIFSTHVLDDVRALCDRVVVIVHGRAMAEGESTDICRAAGCATLEDAFLQLNGLETLAS
jgi:sodium transport system ATP-binding protein